MEGFQYVRYSYEYYTDLVQLKDRSEERSQERKKETQITIKEKKIDQKRVPFLF